MTESTPHRETNVAAYSVAYDREPTDEEMLGLYSIYRAGGLNTLEPYEQLYREVHAAEFEAVEAKSGIIEQIRNLAIIKRLLG